MDAKELKEILDAHAKWLDGKGGARANLAGVNLIGGRKVVGLVAYTTRTNDPFEFFAWRTDQGDYVQAGCRFFTLAEYREHAKTYAGTPKGDETNAILDFFEARFKQF